MNVAKRGQLPHNSLALGDRRDEGCTGVVGRAYRREQTDGRQRWIVIGDFCNGCGTFWPLDELPGWGVRSVKEVVPPEDDELPALVRFMQGQA